jgi:hypothetical protein
VWLSQILSITLEAGEFQIRSKWNLTPLHKKKSKHDINNYRLISFKWFFSKIYEKGILPRLLSETKGLKGHHQHGFMKFHSTEAVQNVRNS